MNRLNLFFFGEERISAEDALYFYGTQSFIVGVLAFTAVFI